MKQKTEGLKGCAFKQSWILLLVASFISSANANANDYCLMQTRMGIATMKAMQS